MNSALASCTDGPGGGARHAATSAKRDRSETGATRKPSRNVGLMVLLKEPMWMTRPPRSSEASAGRGSPLQLQFAQIVVFDHPRAFLRGPIEQTQSPFQRQRNAERRLLPRGHDNQLCVRDVAEPVVDIDAVGVDRYWCKR
jgi:hypothetical protein